MVAPFERRSAVEATPREKSLLHQVLAEIRWAFTPPFTWLGGVAANLVLSLLWLAVVPLRGKPHSDWAILVGIYFGEFILADVTSTNVLGAGAIRTRISLLRGVPLRRLLLVKNLALLLIVGLPTLALTAAITLHSEKGHRLLVTLPGVIVPMTAWLGVGNVVSVLLPVAIVPLQQRWRQRHDLRRMARWLFHLTVPYLLLPAIEPVDELPFDILHAIVRIPHVDEVRATVLLLTGLAFWAAGTAIALAIARRRHLRVR